MLELHPMRKKEFAGFRAWLVEDYANDLARNHHLPIDQARSDAARAIDGMLTKGLATRTHELSNIILRADAAEQRIGYLWIQVEDTKKTCFIAEIYLHPEFRGRGLGRKVLEDLEVRLRQRGIERIGLHVFADNRAASALYTKMGYQITGLHMVKMLTR